MLGAKRIDLSDFEPSISSFTALQVATMKFFAYALFT